MKRLIIAPVVALAVALTLLVGFTGTSPRPVQAATGGPVVLMGIDAEDGGPGGHGPISVYVSVVNSVLANVTNGGAGILVLGGGKPDSGFGPTAFWAAISAGTGVPVTNVNGAAAIAAQSFAGFAMLAVVSDENNTFMGLTAAENNALTARALDFAAFVNAGGGLIGFSSDYSPACSFCSGPSVSYGYLGNVAPIVATTGLGYADITATAAGAAVGISDALDICCWHDVYETYPVFLQVLATHNDVFDAANFGKAAALGGAQVVLSPENCANGIDDDGDGLIDLADPDCSPTGTPTPTPTATPPSVEGRMTGGGSIAGAGVTHGFTLRCSGGPNNLEVNWDGGNKFHLESLSTIACSDNPAINQKPPTAPLDTVTGTGAGRCNGAPASISFTFVDAGEPGTNDTASITITGGCSLSASGNLSKGGNQQAHKR